jgi:hypothetical protein
VAKPPGLTGGQKANGSKETLERGYSFKKEKLKPAWRKQGV